MVSKSAADSFKGLCKRRLFLRIAGPRLLPRQAKALQETPKRGGVKCLAKAGFTEAHKILARKPRKPAIRIGDFEHDADQLFLLVRLKLWLAPLVPAIVKAIEAVRL